MSKGDLSHIIGEDPEAFESLLDNMFYPGSKQRREPARVIAEGRAPGPFDGIKPRVYTVKGKDIDFFTVGQLADALGRTAGTIRRWESAGVIPKATFVAPNPKKDHRAKRRLYTRAQAEGIVRIAREEHIIGDDVVTLRMVGSTNFTERVTKLFRELQK